MSSKSATDKIKNYSSVASNVKNSSKSTSQQTPEEPRITPEQVVAAFEHFNIPINQRGHNDITYWTTKSQSTDGPKLIEELHKRRTEINNKEDERNKESESKQKMINDSKSTLPRLSDNELSALFDEYGLKAPDLEWARNFLPNDPQKVRKILEMQRKMSDDLLKKEAKNRVNTVPEAMPQGQGMQQQMPQQMAQQSQPMQAMGGIGGPLNMMDPSVQVGAAVTPFFIGDFALVKLSNPQNPNHGTLWLVDKKKKVLRPITSEAAIETAFEDPEAAKRSITTLSSQALGPNGALKGFTPLTQEKGLRDDGTMDKIDFSQSQIQNHYGKQENPEAEGKALSMLDGVFGQLNQ